MLNWKLCVWSVSTFDNGWATEKFSGPIGVYQSTLNPVEDLRVELSKELS